MVRRLGSIVNSGAWAVIVGLIIIAFVMVAILGPFGLILLGVTTLFVCTSIDLREDVPTWGPGVFKARTMRPASPEQRAAMQDEKQRTLAPLAFYRWCGVVLVAAGAAGFAWQQLQ